MALRNLRNGLGAIPRNVRGGMPMQRPLQAPMVMPRNPEMVEQINQQMFPQPLPQLDEFGFQKMIPSIPSVQPIMGQPLVPGSAAPTPQTGLGAAELLVQHHKQG